ncbi:MAG: hypothetical protein ACK5HT_13770 [Draconibacterium sp.]
MVGLLYSQVGYETGLPVRIVVRLPEKGLMPETVNCTLTTGTGETKYKTTCNYWGELWKNHWWVDEFNPIDEEGEWGVEINDRNTVLFRGYGLRVKNNILWDSTIEWSGVDMLERRSHFTGVGSGWQDAGTKWVESPAQWSYKWLCKESDKAPNTKRQGSVVFSTDIPDGVALPDRTIKANGLRSIR